MTDQIDPAAHEQLQQQYQQAQQQVAEMQQMFGETYDESCRALGEATLQVRTLVKQQGQWQAEVQRLNGVVAELQAALADATAPKSGPEPEEDDLPVSGNAEHDPVQYEEEND